MNFDRGAQPIPLTIVIPVTRSLVAVEQLLAWIQGAQRTEFWHVIAILQAPVTGITAEQALETAGSQFLTIIRSPSGTSPGAARNLGLKACRTDYVTFMDDDDQVDVDGLAYLIEQAHHGDLDVSGGSYRSIGAAVTVVHSAESCSSLIDLLRPIAGVWRFVYRVKYLEHHRITFSDLLYGEDILFLLRVAETGPRFRASVYPSYIYIAHDGERLTRRMPPFGDVVSLLESLDAIRKRTEVNGQVGIEQVAGRWQFRIKWRNVAMYARHGQFRDAFRVLQWRRGARALERDASPK